MSAPASKPMITDVFVAGARKGWNIATSSTIPNVMMAFIIIKALYITGALAMIGKIFAPIMALVGLPGEAAAVLMSAMMSMGGAVGVVMGLYEGGLITGTHIAILAPAIYLMGSIVQYMGRILGVVGTEGARIPVMFAICIINAFIAMFIMNILV